MGHKQQGGMNVEHYTEYSVANLAKAVRKVSYGADVEKPVRTLGR